MMSRHYAYRQITRTTLRRPFRCLNRTSLRGRRRGPDDLSQALTAFGRALRAYRRLARLAPTSTPKSGLCSKSFLAVVLTAVCVRQGDC
jgi:hypothetical protein